MQKQKKTTKTFQTTNDGAVIKPVKRNHWNRTHDFNIKTMRPRCYSSCSTFKFMRLNYSWREWILRQTELWKTHQNEANLITRQSYKFIFQTEFSVPFFIQNNFLHTFFILFMIKNIAQLLTIHLPIASPTFPLQHCIRLV